MTQTMGTNANNDIYVGSNGNVVILTGQPAVEAGCASISRASLGEEVLSVTSGQPFFQAIFVGVPNLALFDNSLRSSLLSVDGVVAVTNLTTEIVKVNGITGLKYTVTIENQFGLTFVISNIIFASGSI